MSSFKRQKIAIIEPLGYVGGVARFIRCLIHGLKILRPELDITLFLCKYVHKEENSFEEFAQLNVEVVPLKCNYSNSLQGYLGKALRGIQKIYLKKSPFPFPVKFTGNRKKEIESKVKGFDLAYFACILQIDFPNLDCPIVSTVQDFNYNYCFFASNFHAADAQHFHMEADRWLKYSTPIVSTQYMKSELSKFHPEFADKAKVIHVAPFSTVSKKSLGSEQEIVSTLGIKGDYILFPCNFCFHKNQLLLISAFSLLRQRNHQISLVFVGWGTEKYNGKATYLGLELKTNSQDVFGLGYVSNDQIDALIQCAKAVVSTSLYEAGNGPGLDAWIRGIPVAMSNIAPFLEHCEIQGVQAEIFDPLSSKDIADKIENILLHPEEAKKKAQESQKAIEGHTWLKTASEYLKVFDEAIAH